MKISSQDAWLVDENFSVLGTKNSQNLAQTLYHKNLLSRKNGMNHKILRPQKFGTIRCMYKYIASFNLVAVCLYG